MTHETRIGEQKQMFAEGSMDKIFVGKIDKKETQYGEIISVGLTKENLKILGENLNDKGWVNFSIKKSKSGTYYGELFKPAPKQKQDEADLLDEIPF